MVKLSGDALFRLQAATCYCCGQVVVADKHLGEANDLSRCIVCGQDVPLEKQTKTYQRVWRKQHRRITKTLRRL